MADNQESGEQGYSSLDTSSRPRDNSEDKTKTYSGPVGFGEGSMLFVSAVVLLSGVYTAGNSIYRTLRRTDDASVDRAVEYLDDLYKDKETDKEKRRHLHQFVETVMSHHRASIFSTKISGQFDRKKLDDLYKKEEEGHLDSTDIDKSAENLIKHIKERGLFGKYTNNGRRLFNEAVFRVPAEKAVGQISKMTDKEKEDLLSTIRTEYKKSSFSSSRRSLELLGTLERDYSTRFKMHEIGKFLFSTKKTQRMYECIISACDKIKSQTEEKDQTRAASPFPS